MWLLKLQRLLSEVGDEKGDREVVVTVAVQRWMKVNQNELEKEWNNKCLRFIHVWVQEAGG